MNLLDISRNWVRNGVAVIPIIYRDKRPNGTLLGRGWEDFKHRLPTDTELQRWFSSNLHNIGLIVGWNNLVVLDFDDMTVYSKWILWASRRRGYTQYVAETAYRVQTARGVHVYIYLPHREQNRKVPGIDIKAQGGYVLIPPSVHPSGVEYTAINPGAPILMVEALSDILPADLLAQDTEYIGRAGVMAPYIPTVTTNDPWRAAQNVPDPSIDLVTQVRARHSILSLLSGSEPSSGDGRWYVAKCPFHEDNSPSFWIDTTRGICGCYAGCTPKPLDVINLYARLRGVTNREAILYLSRL